MITAEQYITARVSAYEDSERVTALLPLAEAELSSTVFGERYGQACGLMVLHWLTLEALAQGGTVGAIVGPITQEKEGELSRSYGYAGAVGSSNSGHLQSTQFGRELAAMIATIPRGSVAVTPAGYV